VDYYFSQIGAVKESLSIYACDGVGNLDACQACAVVESLTSDTCDGVGATIVTYFRRDRNMITVDRVIVGAESHRHGLVFFRDDVVVDGHAIIIFRFKIMCGERVRHQKE